MNILKNKFKLNCRKESLFHLLNFKYGMSLNYPKIYSINYKSFARNVRTSKYTKQDSELEQRDTTSVINDPTKLTIENINNVIFDFYKQGKQFQVFSSDLKFFDNPDLVEIYKFIVKNFNLIKEEKHLDMFLRAIGYFRIVDEETNNTLGKFIQFAEKNKKVKLAMLSYYTIVKLNIKVEDLENKCLNLTKIHDFQTLEKEAVNPFIWALSEREISTKETNEKIDEYVKNRIDDFNEYEVSIIFRFYSKLFYFNYSVLELLLKKCIEFCPNMTLRYILIVTKCLAEMKIRNLNLLTGIQDRLEAILKLNNSYTTKQDDSNNLSPDSICQILSNFVKLEFIEFEDFLKYENLFFELCEKNGIKNKESIYSIMSTHCIFINKLFVEMSQNKKQKQFEDESNDAEIQNFKKYENSQNINKKSSIKVKKEYKQTNENFIEKITPYLESYKDDMNFQTALNIIVIFKRLNISKRKNLRNLLQLYSHYIDKFLCKKEEIDNQKLNLFISCGYKIFDYQGMRKEISEKLEKYNIAYRSILEEIENKSKSKSVKHEEEDKNF
jgi:hypothetical protein